MFVSMLAELEWIISLNNWWNLLTCDQHMLKKIIGFCISSVSSHLWGNQWRMTYLGCIYGYETYVAYTLEKCQSN